MTALRMARLNPGLSAGAFNTICQELTSWMPVEFALEG
jgi:hypothetical protein